MKIFRWLLLSGAVLPVFAQTANNMTPRQVLDLHNGWNEKSNYNGAKLTLKEVARQGNAVTFQFATSGLPRNRRYKLVSLPIATSVQKVILEGITLDASGLAICSGKPGECGSSQKQNAPVALKVGTIPGEPVRMAIIAMDAESVAAHVNRVLRPVSGSDKACRIEVTLLAPNATMLHVTATGFPPRTAFVLTADSSGKVTTMNLTADANGRYSAGLLPVRPNTSMGTVQVKAKGTACAPAAAIGWTAAP